MRERGNEISFDQEGRKTYGDSDMLKVSAKFPIGLPVRHRIFGFRGVIFDVDPRFDNTEEWYESIPEDMRPSKEQPFYHLFAQNPDETPYIAYVSEQNLMPDEEEEPIRHPGLEEFFDGMEKGRFVFRDKLN
jgi:heat shock protein HspQ